MLVVGLVGGQVKGLGFEFDLIKSPVVRTMLAFVGLILMVVGFSQAQEARMTTAAGVDPQRSQSTQAQSPPPQAQTDAKCSPAVAGSSVGSIDIKC